MPADDDDEKFGEPEFLAYRLLVRLKEESDAQITRGKFLKLSCLADEYLEREYNLDIGFPRYWYKYGEIASENDINTDIYKSGQAIGFSARQYRPSDEVNDMGWESQARLGDENGDELFYPSENVENDDFDVSEGSRSQINDAVRWVAHKFGKEPVREIRRHQYQSHAPREFIRAYSELRWQLENVEPTQTGLEGHSEIKSRKDIIEDLLDEMMITYPEEFDQMETLFLRWEDTMRLLLEEDVEYDQIEKFFESFVETLSRVELRFHFNRNIPEARLENWKDEVETELEEFEVELDEQRQGLLLDQPEISVAKFEKISESYSATVMEDMESLYEEE